jgi:hypothetical protein
MEAMKVIRILGVILGIGLIVLGVCALKYFTEVGVFQRILGGVGMIGTGIYLINYGITGRRYLSGGPPI